MFLGFLGEQDLTLDEKGRLVLPAKFKAFITDPEDQKGFFIIADPSRQDRCLRLYTRAGYREVSTQLDQRAQETGDPVEFKRIFAATSEFAMVDTQSRFVIPPRLVDFAGLDREVVMVGMEDRLEIWDRQEWKRRAEESRERMKAQLAQALRPRKN